MFGRHSAQVVNTGRSFFSSLALGTSLVVVSLVFSATVVAVYGMNIVDRKTGNVFELAETAVQGLPGLIDSLPPVVADLVNDRRQPSYSDELDVSVRLADRGDAKRMYPVVEVHNRGSRVVSLLSMRIVVFNDRDEPVAEINEWAATPIAADHHWRGPLLPGSNRHFSVGGIYLGKSPRSEDLHVEWEITDVRIWASDKAEPSALAQAGKWTGGW